MHDLRAEQICSSQLDRARINLTYTLCYYYQRCSTSCEYVHLRKLAILREIVPTHKGYALKQQTTGIGQAESKQAQCPQYPVTGKAANMLEARYGAQQ